MELFKKGKLEASYLKMGLYGIAGSGKTWTSSLVAIGLHRYIKSDKSIFFLDSETGSDYVLPLFQREKIDLQVAKSRAFADLLDAVDEANKNGSILIIDSLTHHWDELVESYKKRKQLNRLSIQHWGEIKPTWREFSERFVTSNLHIIVCGRSGDVWEDVMDDQGIKELKKTGTRFRTEKEMSYEPSVLVELEIIRKTPKQWIHRAFVVKDRFGTLTFQKIDDPTFEDFLPHIEKLGLKGKHRALDKDRNSQALFNNPGMGEAKYKEKKILLEKIQNATYRVYPGQTQEHKIGRLDLLMKAMQTDSWNEITEFKNDKLDAGLKALQEIIKKESKNATT